MIRSSGKKAVDFRAFLVPMVLITVVSLVAGVLVVRGIRSRYYNSIQNESEAYARSFSGSITTATEAREIVDSLLESRLEVAARAVGTDTSVHSNRYLAEMEETLQVDEIYSYSPEGVIRHSGNGLYLGWSPAVWHPVRRFMDSGLTYMVEDIRQDTESGEYLKYSYFRSEDGSFVQVGIRAEKVQSFLRGFEIQLLLEDIRGHNDLMHISVLDRDFRLLGTSSAEPMEERITDVRILEALEQGGRFSGISRHDAHPVYDVFVPIRAAGDFSGYMHIGRSLEETETVIRRFTAAGIGVLVLIWGALLYALLITWKKNSQLIRGAYFDSETGLPNGQALREDLEELDREGTRSGFLYRIHSDSVKSIGMLYGEEPATLALVEMVRRVSMSISRSAGVYRLSSGTLAVLDPLHSGTETARETADKLLESFREPVQLGERSQHIRIRMGIAGFGPDRSGPLETLRDSAISLGHQEQGEPREYAIFDGAMEAALKRQEDLELELREILEDPDSTGLFLCYQPRLDLNTGRISGMEALARMHSPRLGNISPDEFIPVAENRQLIVPLGERVLEMACRFCRQIRQAGYPEQYVAVNVSGIELMGDGFVDGVLEKISSCDLPPACLELEITESVLISGYDMVNGKLARLRQEGIRIALDDFGTGYSSLHRLGELSVDVLKLDRTFAGRIGIRPEGDIAGDVISMAHKTGLRVVAEGVETPEQEDYFRRFRCDILQGYLFSRPLPEQEAMEFLVSHEKNRK